MELDSKFGKVLQTCFPNPIKRSGLLSYTKSITKHTTATPNFIISNKVKNIWKLWPNAYVIFNFKFRKLEKGQTTE